MAYDTLSPYAGAYPQTKEEIPTSEATGKAMRQAGRDLGVGSLRFGAWAAMAPEIDWLVNRFGETGAAMMMADPSWQDLQKTHPKETEDFRSLWLASKGLRGDKQHQKYAKKKFNKYHDMGFWAWAEQTPEVIDKIVPFENTLGSEAVEDALILLSIGWGVYGITRLLKLGVTKGVPWLRNKIKSIVKKKQGEEILDDIVPEDIVPEAPLQIERKMTLDEFRNNMKEQGITPEWMEGLQKDIAHADETIAMAEGYRGYRRTPLKVSDKRIDKTVERATAGEKVKPKPAKAKDVSEVDTDQLLKRRKNRGKKMADEKYYAEEKIIKEYEKKGIKKVGISERGREEYTIPEGMTHKQMVEEVEEMRNKIYSSSDSIWEKWDNLDIAKDEGAEYGRAYKYWKDRFEKSADFQPSDKLNKALFEDHPEILTQQKRDALAVRHINSPEARAVEKELKEAKKRVGERFKAREIGEAEMYKQGALLREKAYKKLEELLLDQIKSEVELAVSSDPFKEFEDIVLKKGDYKDITKHARGGLVENKVNYALNQWK